MDDLKNRRETVLANLASIRVGKTKLLKMLGNFKEVEDKGEAVDKSLIAKLVDAYDGLTAQEDNYLKVMRDIVQEHVKNYSDESKKCDEARRAEENGNETAEDIIKEVDAIEKAAIEAANRNDILLETMKERIEKKKLLEQLQANNDKATLLEKVEMTKTRILNEKEALGRAEEVRDRLKKEVMKRACSNPPNDVTPQETAEKILPPGSKERVPPVENIPLEDTEVDQDLLVEKIQHHIDSIKARKARMRECSQRVTDMMDLREAHQQAVGRLSNLEEIHRKLEEMQVEAENNKNDDVVEQT